MSNLKTGYEFDDDGHFLREVLIEPNPLEEGKWLVPVNTTTVPLPSFDNATHRAHFDGAKWLVKPKPGEVEIPEGFEKIPSGSVMLFSSFLVAAQKEKWITLNEATAWAQGTPPPVVMKVLEKETDQAASTEKKLMAMRPYFTAVEDFYVLALHQVDPDTRMTPQAFFKLYA